MKRKYKEKFRVTKEERKAWWSKLPDEEKTAFIRSKERARETKPRLELPELTQEEIRQINQNMIDIGMERFIVLEEEGEILY